MIEIKRYDKDFNLDNVSYKEFTKTSMLNFNIFIP